MRLLDATVSGELPTLTVSWARGALGELGGLLQAGVAVPARTGVSALAFLTDQLGVRPAEVADEIKTVFLDGQVVDALDRSILRDGAVLALSAAMPGLVGATLRRGGFYAALRAEITRPPDAPAAGEAAGLGTIRLKLFNLLIDTLGPRVLARGVVLDADAPPAAAPPALLAALAEARGRVLLRVSFTPEVPPCA